MLRQRKTFSSEDLIDVGLYATSKVLQRAIDAVDRDAAGYLARQTAAATGKPALRVDLDAEDTFETLLHTYKNGFFKQIALHGEERLTRPDLDLTNEPSVVALVDAVDGTDLLERGLGNWCCASLFFQPSKPSGSRILAAVVGLPNRSLYYASDGDGSVFVKRPRLHSDGNVRGTSGVVELERASVFFYGQKLKNLRETTHRLAPLLSHSSAEMRIYTLAGIPMMARLIDHITPAARGVDIVFELVGQQPHDAVPGLYLALKAGACVLHLNGEPITLAQLEDALLRPAVGRIRYVVAATERLARAFLEHVQP